MAYSKSTGGGSSKSGSECSNMDECSGSNPCHASATCADTTGGYRCDCPVGYYGNGYKYPVGSDGYTFGGASLYDDVYGSGKHLSTTLGCTNIDQCSCSSASTSDACGYLTTSANYPTSRERLSYTECDASVTIAIPYSLLSSPPSGA